VFAHVAVEKIGSRSDVDFFQANSSSGAIALLTNSVEIFIRGFLEEDPLLVDKSKLVHSRKVDSANIVSLLFIPSRPLPRYLKVNDNLCFGAEFY